MGDNGTGDWYARYGPYRNRDRDHGDWYCKYLNRGQTCFAGCTPTYIVCHKCDRGVPYGRHTCGGHRPTGPGKDERREQRHYHASSSSSGYRREQPPIPPPAPNQFSCRSAPTKPDSRVTVHGSGARSYNVNFALQPCTGHLWVCSAFGAVTQSSESRCLARV